MATHNRFRQVLMVFAPFLVHLLLIAGVAAFVLFYVDRQQFNTTTRRVEVTQADGSILRSRSYTFLQSDITTALSVFSSFTRVVGGWWAGPIIWRCAFIFMEKGGISATGLQRIFDSLPPASPGHFGRKVNFVGYTIILLAIFSVDYYSSVLTGSITWQPAYRYLESDVPIRSIKRFGPTNSLADYRTYRELVTQIVTVSSAIANLAWGGDGGNSTAMKRVLSAARFLPPESALNNITMPHFSVSAFEWVKDPATELTDTQKTLMSTYTGYSPYFAGPGLGGLIPDAQWGPVFKDAPTPTVVSETRLLSLRVSRSTKNECIDASGSIPPEAGRYFSRISVNYDCMVFARVTYQAGVVRCEGCRIASSTVVEQRAGAMQVGADALTAEALALAPYLGTHLVFGGYAVPSLGPQFSAGQRAVELLSRSYQSAWMALTETFGGEVEAAGVSVAVKTTQARVEKWRVYVWCLLHALFSIVVLLFTILHFTVCSHPWLKNPSFAALLLDVQGQTEGPWSDGAWKVKVADSQGTPGLFMLST